MNLPRPLVILFGAGATRGVFQDDRVRPPLDADFFDIAGQLKGRGTGRLAARVFKDVFDINRRVSGIGLEVYYRDIETRLQLLRFAKSQNRPKKWQARTAELQELVRRVLIHTTCAADDATLQPRPSSLHGKILGTLQDGDTLLTFNYDMVIEESMPENGSLWTPRGGYGVETAGITHDWVRHWFTGHNLSPETESRVDLLKLHGSINWTLYKNGNVRLKERPYVVRARRGRPLFEKAAILPPGWNKRVDLKPYSTLWAKARLRLEKCAALVVVGYSLPETDLVARALFQEASRLRAARGTFLKELHVADTNGTVRDRIAELFAPALGFRGHVCRYDGIKSFADAVGGAA